jgi:hypothetical protein
MIPPTTAVISPSEAGIPDARAIPIDKGSAIRNTTTDGGTSFTIPLNLSLSGAIPSSLGLPAVPKGVLISRERALPWPKFHSATTAPC